MVDARWLPLSFVGAALAGLVSCANAVPDSAGAAAEPATSAAAPEAAPAQNTRFSYQGELTQGGWLRGLAPDGATDVTLDEQTVELAEDGTFFAAFDRDSTGEIALTANTESGEVVRDVLSISPRKWNIERVNVAKRTGGGGEAWWKKREPEWLAIRDARAKETGAQGWKQDFIWPVKGRISGRFGRQRIYRGEPGSYHSGIDIAPGNGVPFVAPADGVVVLARTGFSLEGGIIIIDHGAGLNSAFIHLSRLAVSEGDAVKQGQLLGNVGASGRATGPHLHWSLKWNNARLDPLLLTGPMD